MRDCKHGQHARSCHICELEAEVAVLRANLATVTAERDEARQAAGTLEDKWGQAVAERDEAWRAINPARDAARSEGWRAGVNAATAAVKARTAAALADITFACADVVETETKGKEP